MRVFADSKDSEYFATKVEDNGGVYIVPAFSGLGAPYWDMHARGTITGLTRGSGINHIIRAALESIAYQTNDIIRAMSEDIEDEITTLKVDGGASANKFLMQFQADISNLSIIKPQLTEATAAGAAFLAGLAVGFFKNREEISNLAKNCDTFNPSMDAGKRDNLINGWQRAINACKTF